MIIQLIYRLINYYNQSFFKKHILVVTCFTLLWFYDLYEFLAKSQEVSIDENVKVNTVKDFKVNNNPEALEAPEAPTDPKNITTTEGDSWKDVALTVLGVIAVAAFSALIYKYVWGGDTSVADFNPYNRTDLLNSPRFLSITEAAMHDYTGDMNDSMAILECRLNWLENHGEVVEFGYPPYTGQDDFETYEYKDQD